jgi:SAM-dependent methyltransferase
MESKPGRMKTTLTEKYERDRVVWDSCARTYEKQIVSGHPDVTAYEEFEEDFLDRVLHFLMGERKRPVRLLDVGCGSARLHRRFGLQMTDEHRLPSDLAARVRAVRASQPGCAYDSLVSDRLRIVEGIDFSAEMIALAEEKLTQAGLRRLIGSRLKLFRGSAFDLTPMDPEPLPVLVSVCNSVGVMQGPDGAVALLQSLRRAVEKAGGIAIVSAYRKEAVSTFALGNYETTMDVCGQPRWLEPDNYAGSEFVQVPWGYKRAHDTDPKVTVDVLDRNGQLVVKGYDLWRNADAVAQTIDTGHIRTYSDYESRWYAFDQFEEWLDEHWGGLKYYHLPGTSLDVLRAEPAQLAILDPSGHLEDLVARWG